MLNKNNIFKVSTGVVGVVLAILLTMPAVVTGATISMSSSGTYQTGSVVNVMLGVGGLTNAYGNSLSGFDLNLLYDPNALSFNSAFFEDPIFGNQLDLPEIDQWGFLGEAATAGQGVLNIYGISGNSPDFLDYYQENSFVFAILHFAVLQDAYDTSVLLDISYPYLSFLDSYASELPVAYGTISAAFRSGDAAPVPEASSRVLFATGIFIIAFILRRRLISPSM